MHEFIKSIHAGVVANLITPVIVAVLVYFRHGLARTSKIVYHALARLLTRRRMILLWNDADFMYSERLRDLLHSHIPQYTIHCLRFPDEINSYPLFPYFLAAIVLIDTDVTKLAADDKTRKLLEKGICSYIHLGGGIVGTHDLIYRRTRNQLLQEIFGCTTTDFQRKDGPIQYHRSTGPDDPIAADLPEHFELDDGEVVWGSWKSDCQTHFHTGGRPYRPLVVSRSYYKGRLVWLNSGEMSAALCKSIAMPEPRFVLLLRNTISWVAEQTRRTQTADSAYSSTTTSH